MSLALFPNKIHASDLWILHDGQHDGSVLGTLHDGSVLGMLAPNVDRPEWNITHEDGLVTEVLILLKVCEGVHDVVHAVPTALLNLSLKLEVFLRNQRIGCWPAR